MSEYQVITSNFVKVNVSNSENDVISFERKFDKGITIFDLKVRNFLEHFFLKINKNLLQTKLEIVTGGSADTMELELFNGNKLVSLLTQNDAVLGSYPIEDGMRINVKGNFILMSEDTPKFELTDNQYSSKQDTVRHFLKINKLGKYDAEEMKKLEEKKLEEAAEEAILVENCKVGLRCQVSVKNQPRRIGEIMYNGPLDGKKGNFIGVKFDEPLGTNDGS